MSRRATHVWRRNNARGAWDAHCGRTFARVAKSIWFVRGRVAFTRPGHKGRSRSPFPTAILLLTDDAWIRPAESRPLRYR